MTQRQELPRPFTVIDVYNMKIKQSCELLSRQFIDIIKPNTQYL